MFYYEADKNRYHPFTGLWPSVVSWSLLPVLVKQSRPQGDFNQKEEPWVLSPFPYFSRYFVSRVHNSLIQVLRHKRPRLPFIHWLSTLKQRHYLSRSHFGNFQHLQLCFPIHSGVVIACWQTKNNINLSPLLVAIPKFARLCARQLSWFKPIQSIFYPCNIVSLFVILLNSNYSNTRLPFEQLQVIKVYLNLVCITSLALSL